MKDLKESQQSGPDWEELQRALLEEVKDYAIFMVGPDNRIIVWGAGAERITGYRAEEVIGQPGSIIFTPEDIKRAL